MTKKIFSLIFAALLIFTFAVTTFVSAEDMPAPAAKAAAPAATAVKPACPNCQAAVYHGCCEVAPVVIYRRTWFGLGNYYKPVLVYPACAPAPVYRAYPVCAPRYYPTYPAYHTYPAYPVYPTCCW
ncbi:MAG: hypothetical protein LBE18_01730 [Planctomycetaceae bacterium]|nr:hypothetical protein [Planctomycetaceae bacterium]